MKLFAKIILVVFFILAGAYSISASNMEGTLTYKDYIFVLVHGINADGGIFEGKQPYGNLKKYLEENLSLKGRVFAYTFNDPNGSNYDAARELGDGNYHNPKPELNGECWLKKTREEFRHLYWDKHRDIYKEPKDVPDYLIPSNYILITHSMGNLAARAYIYSEKVFGQGKGFYNNDVAKVVFVAPPFLGSDHVPAMMAFWGRAGLTGYSEIKQLIDDQIAYAGLRLKKNDGDAGQFRWNDYQQKLNWNATWEKLKSVDAGKAWQMIQELLANPPGDNPFAAYYAAVIIAGVDIFGPQVFTNGFGYASLKPWWPGMIDLMPYDMLSIDGVYTPLTLTLKEATLADPTREPSYSVVYGRGIPVADWKMSAAMMGIKTYDEYLKQNAFLPSLNYGILSFPFLSQFPTKQGGMLSVTGAMLLNNGFMTNDGDGLVPTYSAKGDGVAHLKNARKYEHVFKTEHFENYLSDQFVAEVGATETAIAAAATVLSGFSPPWTPPTGCRMGASI